jgi:hypothetical protein
MVQRPTMLYFLFYEKKPPMKNIKKTLVEKYNCKNGKQKTEM